jgi:hypothetical protein
MLRGLRSSWRPFRAGLWSSMADAPGMPDVAVGIVQRLLA